MFLQSRETIFLKLSHEVHVVELRAPDGVTWIIERLFLMGQLVSNQEKYCFTRNMPGGSDTMIPGITSGVRCRMEFPRSQEDGVPFQDPT